MTAIATRDELAFVVLYDRYAGLVYSTSLRVLADTGLAEDTAQDVFIRLWRRPQAFIAERGRFITWLVSVTRNRAVDELRARGRRQRREVPSIETGDPPQWNQLAATGDDPLAAAQVREICVRVRAALCDLPAGQKRALELAYFGGLTQQEIAARTGEPLGTIKTRIRLGMRKLRRALQDEKQED
ncbi:MAG: sigma-70 family RNA polymerase sigma factor [Dehalococcoidia bacterium]|nr:sigma-70 family RNA polymerase sigma factor [Dehalococcoidia bacterium]